MTADSALDRYRDRVRDEADLLVELAAGADPGTPVPSCPGWTMADLVTHVGTTHRWVIHILEHRVQERIWSREVPNGLAEGQSGDGAWLADGAGRLLATLRSTDPDLPVWTWGSGRSAAWWARRMAYELLIHRIDAELALGVEPDVPRAVALDAIDELLGNLPHARWVTRHLAELDAAGATLHFHATDTHPHDRPAGDGPPTGNGPPARDRPPVEDGPPVEGGPAEDGPPADGRSPAGSEPPAEGEWTLTQGPAGALTCERGHAKADVAVRGPARDLLLMLYGRRFAATLTVHGDHAFLDRWLDKAAI